MASLSLQHINKTYPNGFEAVKDFNLEIEDKEFIIFVGPSGCGKSTTLPTDCGISRMTFYYHFKDIYDLVEWVCLEESTRALQGKKTSGDWQEGLLQIFEAVYENKAFIMNAYSSLHREQIENFLFRLTHDLIMGVVEEQSIGTSITQAQKNFIADFYKYSFVGIMLDWICQGMKSDYASICQNMCTTLHGNISNSIKNFTKSTK